MVDWKEVKRLKKKYAPNPVGQPNILEQIQKANERQIKGAELLLDAQQDIPQDYNFDVDNQWTTFVGLPSHLVPDKVRNDTRYLQTRQLLDLNTELTTQEAVSLVSRRQTAPAPFGRDIVEPLDILGKAVTPFEVVGGAISLPFKTAIKGDLSLLDRFRVFVPFAHGAAVEREARKMMGMREDEEFTPTTMVRGFRHVFNEIPWYGQMLSNVWVPIPGAKLASKALEYVVPDITLMELGGYGARQAGAVWRLPAIRDAVEARRFIDAHFPDLAPVVKSFKDVPAEKVSFGLKDGGLWLDFSRPNDVAAQIVHEMGHLISTKPSVYEPIAKAIGTTTHPAYYEEVFAAALEGLISGKPVPTFERAGWSLKQRMSAMAAAQHAIMAEIPPLAQMVQDVGTYQWAYNARMQALKGGNFVHIVPEERVAAAKDLIYRRLAGDERMYLEDRLAAVARNLEHPNKAQGLRDLEASLSRLSPDVVEGLDEANAALKRYKTIPRKGLSPEDFISEKEAAWEELVEAVEGLQPGDVVTRIAKGIGGGAERAERGFAGAGETLAGTAPNLDKMMTDLARHTDRIPSGWLQDKLASPLLTIVTGPIRQFSRAVRGAIHSTASVKASQEHQLKVVLAQIDQGLEDAGLAAGRRPELVAKLRADKAIISDELARRLQTSSPATQLLSGALARNPRGLMLAIKQADAGANVDAYIEGAVSRYDRYDTILEFTRELQEAAKGGINEYTSDMLLAGALRRLPNTGKTYEAWLLAAPDSTQFQKALAERHILGADPLETELNKILTDASDFMRSGEAAVAVIEKERALGGVGFVEAAKDYVKITKNAELPVLSRAEAESWDAVFEHPEWYNLDTAEASAVAKLRALSEQNGLIDKQWGVDFTLRAEPYLAHYWTKDSVKAVFGEKDKPLSFVKSWMFRQGFTKERSIPDYHTGRMLGLEPATDDIREIFTTRFTQSANARTNAYAQRLAGEMSPEDKLKFEGYFTDAAAPVDPAIRTLAEGAAISRETVATLDLSFIVGIQGWNLLLRNPVLWGKTIVMTARAMTDPKAFEAWIAHNADSVLEYIEAKGGIRSTLELTESGVRSLKTPLSTAEKLLNMPTKALGVEHGAGSFLNWLNTTQYGRASLILGHAFWKRDLEFLRAAEGGNWLKVLGQDLKELSFFSALPDTIQAAFIKGPSAEVWRVRAIKELSAQEWPSAAGQKFDNLTNPVKEQLIRRQAREIWEAHASGLAADNASNVLGGLSEATIGRTPTRKALERILFFAPDFLRARLGLLATLPRSDMQGILARSYIGSTLIGSAVVAELFTWGFSSWAGKAEHANLTDMDSPDWLDVRLPDGGRIGVLGQYKTLMRFVADPKLLSRWFKSKLSVPVGEAIAQFTNKDFLGAPIVTSRGGPGRLGEIAAHAGQRFLPISAQQVMETTQKQGADVAGLTETAALSFGGFNIIPPDKQREVMLDKMLEKAIEAGVPEAVAKEMRERRRSPFLAEKNGKFILDSGQRNRLVVQLAQELGTDVETVKRLGTVKELGLQEKEALDKQYFSQLRGVGEQQRANVSQLEAKVRSNELSPYQFNQALIKVRENARAQRAGITTSAAFKETVEFLKSKPREKETQEALDRETFFDEVFRATADPITLEPIWDIRDEAMAAAKKKYGEERVLKWLAADDVLKGPVERARDEAAEVLKNYWDIKLPAPYQGAYKRFVQYAQTHTPAQEELYLMVNPHAKQAITMIRQQRELLRRLRPAVDRALVTWYDYKPITR